MLASYDPQHNTQAGPTYRSTLLVKALSYAFAADLRNEFRALNFPIDDAAYAAICADLPPAGTLDVDASNAETKYDALTDGLLVIRYLLGLTEASLPASALGGTPARSDAAAIKTYLDDLDGIRPDLDVDSNGTAEASTDGVLILRYLFGLRGDSLIAGALGPLATRTTAPAIEARIRTLLP
jgi:hypothetical protein